MSHDGTERIIYRRTPESELDDAVDRVLRRAGAGVREVCLQYDFGYGMSRSICGESLDIVVPLDWEEWDEETGARVLGARDVPIALATVRGLLLRPVGLARKLSEVLGDDWTADEVRSLLRKYRKDADASSAESDGERILQVAAQLQALLEKAASRGEAVVESRSERP
jgi:hypothetical protein